MNQILKFGRAPKFHLQVSAVQKIPFSFHIFQKGTAGCRQDGKIAFKFFAKKCRKKTLFSKRDERRFSGWKIKKDLLDSTYLYYSMWAQKNATALWKLWPQNFEKSCAEIWCPNFRVNTGNIVTQHQFLF